MLRSAFIINNTANLHRKLTIFGKSNCQVILKKYFSESSGNGSAYTRGPVTYLGLSLMLAAGGGVLYFYNSEKEKKIQQLTKTVTTTGKASLGGPWVLVDQDGKVTSDESLRGKYCLLYFGFTYCPDICPSELVKVGKIMHSLCRYFIPIKIII